MNKEQILKIIDRKYAVISEETKATGVCLRLNNGAIINCFNNGNHNVQGKNAQEVKDLLDGKICNSVKRKIFVVYGHDDNMLFKRTQDQEAGKSKGISSVISMFLPLICS